MSTSAISWANLTGRELYLAFMCSPALRLERKRAYARERAINSGQIKVRVPRKPLPARSREIWQIAPLLNSSGIPTPDADAISYCLHPHTGQPLVVNGSCLVYDGESRNFRMVQFTDGKGSDWARQSNIIDGEAHLACDGGTLVAIYRQGKCVSSSFVSLVTSNRSRDLMAMIFGKSGAADITRSSQRRRSGKSSI